MSNLHRVSAAGQSIWLDNLRRGLVSSGELQRLTTEDAVSGVTSNPTILAAAMSASNDYDEQLRRLASAGASGEELYAELAAADIRGAADVLRPVWQRTKGSDGFVSVEVSPGVAHDTEATVAEAHAWIKRIDRDNLLVKVPANSPGLAAIERLTAEGVSVNVTLIFSLERYRAVAEAYLRGLERFIADGGDPSKVVSFASFFVSRVDVEVDRRLDHLAKGAAAPEAARLRSLAGKAGIANARAAYGIFEQVFSGTRWQRLAALGAHAQKPLWASTGVKDPSRRDTIYVEELLAPNTVNTMPEATIRAFQDHGDPASGPFGKAEIAAAHRLLRDLAEVGVDYDDVTNLLERQGIERFAGSFDELMRGLESKRAEAQGIALDS
jgi:transaldolase